MKGILVAKPFIYTIEVKGEDFCQGDTLTCSLTIENPTDQNITASGLRLDLARADLKKMKKRDLSACDDVVVMCESVSPEAVGPKAKIIIPWIVNLNQNCVVTDSAQTLCLRYGSTLTPESIGQLLLTVKPHRYLQQIFTIFESMFQFVPKSQRWSDGWVELKLKPPTARALAFVDELMLAIRFDQQTLELRYKFKLKVFDTATLVGQVKKKETIVEQRLEPDQYLLTETHLNQDLFETKINEALAVVSTAI